MFIGLTVHTATLHLLKRRIKMHNVQVKIDPKTLNIILSPQALQEIIDGQCKDAFAKGMKTALESKGAQMQNKTKFDPEKHVDKSLYGYTTQDGLNALNKPGAKILFSREPNGMENALFCKITPLITEVKNG